MEERRFFLRGTTSEREEETEPTNNWCDLFSPTEEDAATGGKVGEAEPERDAGCSTSF